MKLIKLAIFVIIVVVVLNYFGLLSPEFSEKVDTAVESTLDKVNNIEYKGKKLTDMSLKEIAGNVRSDIDYITEEVITEDGIVFKGEKMQVKMNTKNDRIIEAKLDASDVGAVKTVEKLIKDFTGTDYSIPEELKQKGNIELYVERNSEGKIEVKFI